MSKEPIATSATQPPREASIPLDHAQVAHMRDHRTRLLQEWVRRMSGDKLLKAMTDDEIFAEATAVYDHCLEALETGSSEALQAFAREFSERLIRRGVATHEVLGILLSLRDVLARSLQAKYREDSNLLSRVLDAYEPASNRVLNTVAVGFVEARERVIHEQQEEALRNSEKRLRTVVENSIQGTLVHRHFKPLLVNPALADIWGYSSPEEVMRLPSSVYLCSERERERVTAYKNARMAGKPVPTRYEMECVRKDGTIFWCETLNRIIEWDGEPAVLATMVDITERHQREEALRRSEQKFRNLVEGSIQGVFVHRDFRILFSNEAFAQILGSNLSAELIGFNLMEVFLPELRTKYEEQYQARIRGQKVPPHFENQWVRRDGSLVWTDLVITVVDWEGEPAVQVAVIDITERKRVEAALKQSEERYRNLVEGSLQGIIVHRDFKPLFANQAYAALFGYDSLGEILSLDSLLAIVAPHERDRIIGYKNARMTVRYAPEFYEFQGIRKDGSLIWLECMSRVITWDGQRAIQSTFTDFTVRKSLEEQLRQSQKLDAIGKLAGGVAHDFNNMLQIIGGFSNLALEDMAPQDKNYDKLRRINEAVQKAASLTKQLLTLSRRQVFQPQHSSLQELVGNLASLIRRLIGENIDLIVSHSDTDTTVYADHGAIEQVLINLCINARDAMPNGGRLAVETQLVTLDDLYCASHASAHAGKYVCIAVTDNGTGIAPEDLPHIFEPFFTTKQPGEGTGLGLTLAYSIITQHKGFLNVYSEQGLGSTFKVYLPYSEESLATEQSSPTWSLSKGTETILIAEDEEGIRQLLTQVLESHGYTVIAAEDGESAIELYKRNPAVIHLVIVDFVMPKLSGREVYERIVALNPTQRVLFMSGYSPKVIDIEFIVEKKISLISKPFAMQELLAAVRGLLETL